VTVKLSLGSEFWKLKEEVSWRFAFLKKQL